jgi:hypothetical protein
VSLEHTLFLDF